MHIREEFLAADICLTYPRQPYPGEALVYSQEISKVLAEFKRWLMLDQHIYLRSGSLNMTNGFVGLKFSCEGSHYLNCAEFITHARDLYG